MVKVKIVVVGGGFAGCAAALTAAKLGADVTLIERTDELLGTGRAGGFYRNNGRFVGAEELIAMGAGDIFKILDATARHKNIEIPGHKHLWVFDVHKVEPLIREALLKAGVKIEFQTRFVDVRKEKNRIISVKAVDTPLTTIRPKEREFEADAFIDATGTTGSEGNCRKYGNGCTMCVLRCPTFGPRVSVTEKAGVKELASPREVGSELIGAFSGACEIHKDCLDPDLRERLEKYGTVQVPVPKELMETLLEHLRIKACQQYAGPAFAEKLVIVDNGYAKILSAFLPVDILRKIPGFRYARYTDPCSGGIGNSIRWLAMAPRDNTLKVKGIDNLFCAGEKAFVLGHTEAIDTGALAAYNAVKTALGDKPLELPAKTTAIGALIAYSGEILDDPEKLKTTIERPTLSGGPFFVKLSELGLYTTDVNEIRKRIEHEGLTNIFSEKLC